MMTIFILFISIIINVVSIFGIIILYMRQNRLLQVDQDQKKVLKDMEEMFSSYLLEMRDENEAFIKKVQGHNHQSSLHEIVDQGDLEKETLSKSDELSVEEQPFTAVMRNHAAKKYKTMMSKTDKSVDENKRNDFSTLPLEKQAFLLEKKGLTIEQIAQKLHKGKTEIELLLKFRQKM
ncbi:MAG: hypothetical protein ACO1OT_11250 [Heyndrickxia sp.]